MLVLSKNANEKISESTAEAIAVAPIRAFFLTRQIKVAATQMTITKNVPSGNSLGGNAQQNK